MILKGMGELHLDIKIDILKRTHKVEVSVGAPQVAYRETITKPSPTATPTRSNPVVPVSSRRSTTPSSRGEAGSGFVFESKVVGGNVPKEFHPRCRKGLQDSIEQGTTRRLSLLGLQGYPQRRWFPRRGLLVNIAFEIAAKAAYRQTMPKAARRRSSSQS